MSFHTNPVRSLGVALFLLCSAGMALVWLTIVCLRGEVEYRLSPQQMRGGRLVWVKNFGAPEHLLTREMRIEVLEGGRPLGPQVEDLAAIRDMGPGAFAVPVEESGTLYFSASDMTSPRSNGRRYAVRFPRRLLPAATVLVLASWALFFWVLALVWRGSLPPPIPNAAAWSVFVAGGTYSLFVVQTWLPQANTPWLMAVAAIVLAPFLARIATAPGSLPAWSPWVAGLLVWAAFSGRLGSSYASTGAALGFLAVSAGGIVAYLGLRAVLQEDGGRGLPLLVILFLLGSGLSIARDAGIESSASLFSLASGHSSAAGVINPWTTKFTAHWILVLGWSAVAALTVSARRVLPGVVMVATVTGVTIALNGSRSAMVALALSTLVAAAACLSPRTVRRVVVLGLLGGVLLAPLLAGLAWKGQSALSGQVGEEVQDALDLDRRGGRWEYSRRLIALRPLEGWGFGASAGLPGRDLLVDDAFGPAPAGGERRASYRVLAGGHPHNGALLTWLDLGLVGALLLAGLVAAAGRSIAAQERRRGTHAAMLGLLTVVAIYLIFNYPAWDSEVASILWMSAVLPAAILPRPVARRELLWSGAAVLAILAFGAVLPIQDRLSRRLILRDLDPQVTMLRPEAGALTVRDEVREIEYSPDLDAGAELLPPGPRGALVLRGWAYGPPGTGAPDAVLVFVGSELAGVVWPERPTPEVFIRSEPRDVQALVSGFLLRLEPERLDLGAPVTLVVLKREDALASELPPLVPEPAVDAPDA